MTKSKIGKHPAGKRDLLCHSNGKGSKRQCWYVKRTPDGKFKSMAKVKSSQPIDKSKKAINTCKSGYCDQGDRNVNKKSSVAKQPNKKKSSVAKQPNNKKSSKKSSKKKNEGLSVLASTLLILSAILLVSLIIFWFYQLNSEEYYDEENNS